MSRKKTLKPRWAEGPQPGCETCVERKTCARAQEGTFCTRWRTEDREPAGRDPNEAWRSGDGDAPEE